jgi:hypothetical protein
MRCWGRGKSKARKGIKYSQYQPLRPDADTMLESVSVHSVLSEDDMTTSNPEKSSSTGLGWLRGKLSRS